MTFLQIQKKYEKLLKQKEKGIVKNYAKAYKELEQELKTIYDKYEKEGQISMDDMRKYNRMELLDKKTAKVMISLYKLNDKLINETLREIVETTQRESIKTIVDKTTLTAIKKNFDVTKVVNAEVAGRNWKERTKHYEYNFTYDMHSVIKQGIEKGETYTTMCKNLKKKMGKDIKKPMQIVRTESHRAIEYSKMEVMQEVNKQVKLVKVWHTVGDERVRSSHQAMEGVEVDFDELFTLPSGAKALHPTESGNPDEDVNCRCWVEYKIKE